jgi:hypothetical protein
MVVIDFAFDNKQRQDNTKQHKTIARRWQGNRKTGQSQDIRLKLNTRQDKTRSGIGKINARQDKIR